MFNIGFSELIVILVIALVFIGPKQLPEVARVIGRLMGEFRKATSDLTGSFNSVQDQATQAIRDTEKQITESVKVDLSKERAALESAVSGHPDEPDEHDGHEPAEAPKEEVFNSSEPPVKEEMDPQQKASFEAAVRAEAERIVAESAELDAEENGHEPHIIDPDEETS